LVTIDIVAFPLVVRVWIRSPAFDRKKEILLHLRPCVVHAVTDSHVRVLWVEIDFQRLILDRDVGFLAFVRGASVPRSRNSGLPGTTVGKDD